MPQPVTILGYQSVCMLYCHLTLLAIGSNYLYPRSPIFNNITIHILITLVPKIRIRHSYRAVRGGCSFYICWLEVERGSNVISSVASWSCQKGTLLRALAYFLVFLYANIMWQVQIVVSVSRGPDKRCIRSTSRSVNSWQPTPAREENI